MSENLDSCGCDDSSLTDISIRINLRLRSEFVRNNLNHEISHLNGCYPVKPFGGGLYDSIGPFPEYILHTLGCVRSQNGCCSPCGYSDGRVYDKKYLHDSVIKQVEYIFSDCGSNVSSKQSLNDRDCDRIVITPVGSFFSEIEMPSVLRKKVIKLIYDHSKNGRNSLGLFIESHAVDFLEAFECAKIKSDINLLVNMDTTIVFGFESVNDFVRNVLYCKYLEIKDFEVAICCAKNAGLKVGAFVYAGCHSMTQDELVSDVEKTIKYLKGIGVMPVIMISNFKANTLDYLLFRHGRHDIVQPFTIKRIIDVIHEHYGDSKEKMPWLIADPVGGPPEPIIHSFGSNSLSCDGCSQKILQALRYLRETYDWCGYYRMVEQLENCECYGNYLALLERERRYSKLSLAERARDNLSFAYNILW